MSLEACPSLEVSIQEVSLSVPSYPVQWTRYNSFWLVNGCQSWNQGFRRFQILVRRRQGLVGVGVEHDQGSGLGLLVLTWICGKPGVQCGDCWEVIG